LIVERNNTLPNTTYYLKGIPTTTYYYLKGYLLLPTTTLKNIYYYLKGYLRGKQK